MSSDYTPPNLVKPTPGGNPGDGTLNGNFDIKSGGALCGKFYVSGNDLHIQGGNQEIGNTGLWLDGYGAFAIVHIAGAGSPIAASIELGGKVGSMAGVSCVGYGLAPLYGKDVRTGLTAADASATTLYTTTAAGQVYEVAARIFGTGGTITSGVYTIGWTEGGVARTATVSVTAAGTLASAVFLLQPDSGTAITAQLTTLSGTSPVANVAAVVKQDV